jgi:nicotinate-nucleotide adenylyltransferase
MRGAKKSLKVALFGGTFDPVHVGHLAIARAAMREFRLDRVYFVPASVPPHKQRADLTEFHHRFAMLALATAEEDRFVPSPMEAQAAGPNYSIDTVRALKKTLEKDDRLYFLIGIDAFLDLSTWRHPVELLSECDFIVVSRPGYSLADVGKALPDALRPAPAELRRLRRMKARGAITLPSTTIRLLGNVKKAVSSTEIRAAALKAPARLRRLVTPEVAAYIRKEHLYVPAPAQPEKESTILLKVLSFDRERRSSR